MRLLAHRPISGRAGLIALALFGSIGGFALDAAAEVTKYRPPAPGTVLVYDVMTKTNDIRDMMQPKYGQERHRIGDAAGDASADIVRYEVAGTQLAAAQSIRSFRGIVNIAAESPASTYRFSLNGSELRQLWPLEARTKIELRTTWNHPNRTSGESAFGPLSISLRVEEPEIIETRVGRVETYPITRIASFRTASGSVGEKRTVRTWFAPSFGWVLRSDAIIESNDRKMRILHTIRSIDVPTGKPPRQARAGTLAE